MRLTLRQALAVPLILVAVLAPLVGQTSDYSQMSAEITAIVAAVIPVLVLVLVLKMLFRSFNDMSRMQAVRRLAARLLEFSATLLLLGQTSAWSTDMDIWSTITGLVLLVLPFLVLIIVLRSVFKYFTREW